MEKRETKFCIYCILFVFLIAACSAQRYPGDQCTDSRDRNGVCTPLRQCASVQEELKRGARPTNCGFQDGQPIVCCPVRTSSSGSTPRPSQNPGTSHPARKTGETAKTWCKKYGEACPRRHSIVRRTPALPDEFPHMAAIGYGSQNNIQWICAGSLISETFVLTVAHCLKGVNVGPAQWVLLGTVNLAANESALGQTGQIHRVIRRIQHPGYRPPARYDDVALLEIGPAVTRNPRPLLSKELHPACLRTDNLDKIDSYIATGWGRVEYGEDGSTELLKVELDPFDEAKCNETYDVEIRTTNKLRRGIDSTMMCAGILRGEKHTCQTQSGGPLQLPTIGTCQYEISGITTFGTICAFGNYPSVYMRVSAYIGWIEDNVWSR